MQYASSNTNKNVFDSTIVVVKLLQYFDGHNNAKECLFEILQNF